MSFMITSYDRTSMCNHYGVLGRKAQDGTRTCVRCGTTVRPETKESFTEPAGRESSRRTKSNTPR